VAGRDRTVEQAGFASRAHDHEVLAVELFGNRLGFRLALKVAGLELGALAFELLLVGFVGAQGLALGQKEIAGKTVLDLDGVAHLAEARDAFEKDDFHVLVLSCPKRAETNRKGRKLRRAVAPFSLSCPIAAVRGGKN